MGFPLNHIFKNHSSYSIEYKHLIINMEINNTIIIASRAYFQQTPTCTRVNNLVCITSFTPMAISVFVHALLVV